MSDGKSGYEIRADLLHQAQGLLVDNYQRKADAIYLHNEHNPQDLKYLPANTISASDVIEVAKELYEFVNQK